MLTSFARGETILKTDINTKLIFFTAENEYVCQVEFTREKNVLRWIKKQFSEL